MVIMFSFRLKNNLLFHKIDYSHHVIKLQNEVGNLFLINRLGLLNKNPLKK